MGTHARVSVGVHINNVKRAAEKARRAEVERRMAETR